TRNFPVWRSTSAMMRWMELVPMSIAARRFDRLFPVERGKNFSLELVRGVLQFAGGIHDLKIELLRQGLKLRENPALVFDKAVVEIHTEPQVHSRFPVVDAFLRLLDPVPFRERLGVDDARNEILDRNLHIEDGVRKRGKTEHLAGPRRVDAAQL